MRPPGDRKYPHDPKDVEVEIQRVGQAHGHELPQQRRQLGPALQDVLVEGRALLARQAAERHENRPSHAVGFEHRGAKVGAPPHGREGFGQLRLRQPEHLAPVDARQRRRRQREHVGQQETDHGLMLPDAAR